jgi:hypothetical protein
MKNTKFNVRTTSGFSDMKLILNLLRFLLGRILWKNFAQDFVIGALSSSTVTDNKGTQTLPLTNIRFLVTGKKNV